MIIKHQIPNSKHQTNSKMQNHKLKTVWSLSLEIWNLFGIWCLVLGICLEFGAWCLGFVWYLVPGIWNLNGYA
jgi:hypothetical protein